MANKETVAVGVDCGSAWTRALFLSLDQMRVSYLGHGVAESRGWSKGRMTDPTAIGASVREALSRAERSSGVSAEAAVAGIGGGIDGSPSRGLYEFGRKRPITREDLIYAIERASRLRLEDDRLILMVMPQNFTVDGRAGFSNPNGTPAERLEANVQVITASFQEHECLVASIHESHLSVEETVFEAVAASYAAVLPEERERGVAVIDIGAQSTEVAMYAGEALVASVSVPIGGEHFTRDIAYCLTISFEDAEQLKCEYGWARMGQVEDANLIEIPSHEGRPPREAPRGHLNEILEARAEELFRYVREEVERAGMAGELLEGAILTGGGATLGGMLDVAERELQCPARNGLPVGIRQLPDSLTTPAWTTAAGLALYSARLKAYRDGRSRPPGFLNMILR
ncbi:MAG: cell division protein FtsA [Bryobacteraceae bacterium]|nr:cell division protein FtsA [Bryobacteraceae bacterium]